MSRKDAHAFAASLAATLMVSIVVFQAGDGTFGAVPADEIGPAPVLFRSRAHVRRPFVRRPLVISSRGLNVSGAGCRSR